MKTVNELMNKEISKVEFLEGLRENGYSFDESTIEQDLKEGYFYATLDGYQDADCIEVKMIDEDTLIANFQ